jgi:hypothetical protein
MGVEAAREYHAERKRELAQKEKEEALEQLSPWSEQLQEAKREPIREPDHSVAILVAELAEALLRHERTINQLDIHIKASQDQEIARLRSRVDELEKRKGRASNKK